MLRKTTCFLSADFPNIEDDLSICLSLLGVSDLGVGLHTKSTLHTFVVHYYPAGLTLALPIERPSSGGFTKAEVGRITLP